LKSRLDDWRAPIPYDESSFTPECIIGHKTIDNVSHYLIQWKGFEKNASTWDTVENLTKKYVFMKDACKEYDILLAQMKSAESLIQ
jgi:hypothetical protein